MMAKRSGRLIPARVALLAVLACGLSGCGLFAGYAPEDLPVHRGHAGPAAVPAPDSLRVVSWNIKYGEAMETALTELCAHPRLADPDLLLVQEVSPDDAALLADSLGLHHVYRAASVHPHNAELFGNAVLSRWPIAGHQVLVLPHPTPVSGHRRVAVAATVDLGARGELVAVSVHTATLVLEQDKRFDQAAAVLDSLDFGSRPVVVAGDFNTATGYEVTLLRRLARKRGFTQVHLPAGPTVTKFLGEMAGRELVLDHVLVRDLEAGARGVVRTTTASDHFPVWAVLAAPRKQE
ncbi:MAG: endonuclease [bacterium]|nr:endonuclease [bacterium]